MWCSAASSQSTTCAFVYKPYLRCVRTGFSRIPDRSILKIQKPFNRAKNGLHFIRRMFASVCQVCEKNRFERNVDRACKQKHMWCFVLTRQDIFINLYPVRSAVI